MCSGQADGQLATDPPSPKAMAGQAHTDLLRGIPERVRKAKFHWAGTRLFALRTFAGQNQASLMIPDFDHSPWPKKYQDYCKKPIIMIEFLKNCE